MNAQLSRISKLFIDRDEMHIKDTLIRRQNYFVTIRCGRDIEKSRTLQVALLTAANIANKCFPGAVRVVLKDSSKKTPLLIWQSLKLTLGQALTRLLGPQIFVYAKIHNAGNHDIVLGDAQPMDGSLRITFDGWIGKVGPADSVERLPENEYCPLSGVLSAALAISELFLSFAEINVEASRRAVGLSLWRPELNITNPEAIGVPIEFLPRDMWVLGLGHLGNAYLWSLSMLPYLDPMAVEIILNDFDKIEPENVETGLIFNTQDIGNYKTRVCSGWLEKRKFKTRIVERYFDSNFQCRKDEPQLALCGFDSNSPRRDLVSAQFNRVVESGLGGTANNFDTISLHTLPNMRPPEEMWPDPKAEEMAEHQLALARKNHTYLDLAADECGRFNLAGKSVAVPFVGAVAGSLVIAEIIRLLHRGPAYTNIKLTLTDLNWRHAQTTRNYDHNDFIGLTYYNL